MSLSTCEYCGGHIPLGPDASNHCESCGRHVFEGMNLGPQAEIFSLRAKVQKMQDLLDAITTPNVSYFDMTPAEEIAQLEARLKEGQSVLKRRCEECDRYRASLLLIMRVFSCDRYNPDGAEPTCRDQVPTGKERWCPHCIACEALEPKP